MAESKLKVLHLLWVILIAFIAAGIAWGIMTNQQSVNTENIKLKVDKDIYVQHVEHQKQQFNQIQKGIDEIKEELRRD